MKSHCTDSSVTSSRRQVNLLTGRPYSQHYHELCKLRERLPINTCLTDVLAALRQHRVLVLEGETGSGKTTQVPQYLLESSEFPHCIGVTQPRRVAAMSIAGRVAEELDVELGEEVGYSVRFDDCSSEKTRIKYLTDGMLIRELMTDQKLSGYSVIILDEAHERTNPTEILFGVLKDLLAQRTDLHLVIMSATIQASRFAEFFEAPVITVPGRVYPVSVSYLSSAEEDYVAATVRTIMHIHSFEAPGDILAFLTGEEEIELACKNVRKECAKYGESLGQLDVLPLYSSLPPQQQQLIFRPAPQPNSRNLPGRKCVVATNIAETSITIDGIVYVIDSGLVKEKNYNPALRIDSLLVAPISKASAGQRMGRAGRTQPGTCFRLYTEPRFNRLPETQQPEILRSNLANVILLMKSIGIDDLVTFDYLDPPAPQNMMRALETLNYLGALDDDCTLTEEGKLMAQFPLEPELSKMLLESTRQFKCSEQVLTLVAMLSVLNPFVRPKEHAQEADQRRRDIGHSESDHLTLINVYNAFIEHGEEWCSANWVNARSLNTARDIRTQVEDKMQHLRLPIVAASSEDSVRMCLLSAYFMQVVFQERPGYFVTVREQQRVFLHPSHGLKRPPEWCVYHEYILTSKQYVRTVTTIKPEWLLQIAPEYFSVHNLPASSARQELQFLRSTMTSQ